MHSNVGLVRPRLAIMMLGENHFQMDRLPCQRKHWRYLNMLVIAIEGTEGSDVLERRFLLAPLPNRIPKRELAFWTLKSNVLTAHCTEPVIQRTLSFLCC